MDKKTSSSFDILNETRVKRLGYGKGKSNGYVFTVEVQSSLARG